MAVTLEAIKAGLTELGLNKGDVVFVHSDLTKLDKPRDLVKLPNCGADIVIDAFIETVAGEGIVAFPAFSNTIDRGEGKPPVYVFDPAETPSRVGSITNIFRKRPGVARSLHPTHSVSALGDRAEAFCEAPDDQSTFDRRGPWGKMYDWDGLICWFGTNNRTNTMVHVVEEWMALPYMEEGYAWVKGPDGEPIRKKITQSPGGPRDFYRAESKAARLLDESGVVKTVQIGRATVSMLTVRDCHRVLKDGIVADPCLLLKEETAGEWTSRARRETIAHVREKFVDGKAEYPPSL